MKLQELFHEFEELNRGTTIQKQEHLKKFINNEILISGIIRDIRTNEIELKLDIELPSDMANIKIYYDSEMHTSKLLEYSVGDYVTIVTKINKVIFKYYSIHDSYEFDFLK